MIKCVCNKKKCFCKFCTVIACSLLLAVTGIGPVAGAALEAGLAVVTGTEAQDDDSLLLQIARDLGPTEVEAAAVKKGWKRDSKGHRLYYKNGKKVKNRWLKVSGKWYLFNKKGYALKGWQNKSGKWYYLNTSNCAMKTGWLKSKNNWYYLDPKDGHMRTGWITVKGKRYYMNSSGVMQTGWLTLDGKKYFLGSDGAMLTGTQTLDGKEYTFSEDGILTETAESSGEEGAAATDTPAEESVAQESGQPAPSGKKIVVIDPGHSSRIPSGSVPVGPGSKTMKAADAIGTRGVATKIYEYELVLTVSVKLKKELEARGYEVYMTRTDSQSAHSCIERAEVANSKNADVFIRVHANGSSDKGANGAMTICITKNNPYIKSMYTKSRLLSDCVLNSYCKATGAKKEYVWETDTMTGNNWAKVPTTIIELGYMTNAAEDKKMATEAYQKKMVQGMADGIDAYFKNLK